MLQTVCAPGFRGVPAAIGARLRIVEIGITNGRLIVNGRVGLFWVVFLPWYDTGVNTSSLRAVEPKGARTWLCFNLPEFTSVTREECNDVLNGDSRELGGRALDGRMVTLINEGEQLLVRAVDTGTDGGRDGIMRFIETREPPKDTKGIPASARCLSEGTRVEIGRMSATGGKSLLCNVILAVSAEGARGEAARVGTTSLLKGTASGIRVSIFGLLESSAGPTTGVASEYTGHPRFFR
jgi:hypothetical protein